MNYHEPLTYEPPKSILDASSKGFPANRFQGALPTLPTPKSCGLSHLVLARNAPCRQAEVFYEPLC